MKKTTIAGLVVLAVILSGCGKGAKETATPEVEIEFAPVISATGEVVPAAWATLSAQTGGTVMEVLVEPGDEVAAGDPLVRLDPTDAQLAVQQAEAALAVARKTDRILIMRDGRIVHEHTVGTPFEEDLAAFRRSGLGQAILAGDEAVLARFGSDERAALRRLLEGVT